MNKQELEEKAIAELERIEKEYDIEEGHVEADFVLCDLLELLGYKKVTDKFHKIRKWYA